MSLNNETCIISPTLNDLNPVKLNYCQFMTSLNKFSESCNSVDDLSTKLYVPSKTKDRNIKVFNVITNKNKAKSMVKRILCGCKCSFNCNSNQKSNNDKCQCE